MNGDKRSSSKAKAVGWSFKTWQSTSLSTVLGGGGLPICCAANGHSGPKEKVLEAPGAEGTCRSSMAVGAPQGKGAISFTGPGKSCRWFPHLRLQQPFASAGEWPLAEGTPEDRGGPGSWQTGDPSPTPEAAGQGSGPGVQAASGWPGTLPGPRFPCVLPAAAPHCSPSCLSPPSSPGSPQP